jgi:hypothetical protein
VKQLTQEQIADLSQKIDSFVELELGRKIPFVCLLYAGEGRLGIFTNRKDNAEVHELLSEALKGLEQSAKWRNL